MGIKEKTLETLASIKNFFLDFFGCSSYDRTFSSETENGSDTRVSDNIVQDLVKFDPNDIEPMKFMLPRNFEIFTEYVLSIRGEDEKVTIKKLKDDCAIISLSCLEKMRRSKRKPPTDLVNVILDMVISQKEFVIHVSLGDEKLVDSCSRDLREKTTSFVNCLAFQDQANVKYLQENFNLFLAEFKKYSIDLVQEDDVDKVKNMETFRICREYLFQIGQYLDTIF